MLTAIVGIGAVTAATLLTEFGAIEQYASAKAAAAGLTPSQFESGTSVRWRARLSKIGKAGIRAALYWPAITAMTRWLAFKAFAGRMAARGKPKKVDYLCGDAQTGAYCLWRAQASYPLRSGQSTWTHGCDNVISVMLTEVKHLAV